jgi:hypothetical protein
MPIIILEYIDANFTNLHIVTNPLTKEPLLFKEFDEAKEYGEHNCIYYKLFPLDMNWDWVAKEYCWLCEHIHCPFIA